jgi:hypothetical protein
MQKLSKVFNEVFSRDRVEGAAMAAAGAGTLTLGNVPAMIGAGIIGAIMGRERLTETFNAAVYGRQMATEAVPAVIRRMAPGG